MEQKGIKYSSNDGTLRQIGSLPSKYTGIYNRATSAEYAEWINQEFACPSCGETRRRGDFHKRRGAFTIHREKPPVGDCVACWDSKKRAAKKADEAEIAAAMRNINKKKKAIRGKSISDGLLGVGK